LRIFGPKRDEVTGECRKLYNEKLNDQYSSSNTVWLIEKNVIGRACSTYGGGERHVQDFGGES